MKRLLLVVTLFGSIASAGPGLEPSNPNASAAARRVLTTLAGLPDRPTHRLLSGQNVGHGPEVTAGYTTWVVNLHRDTGKWVGVVGADYALGSLDDKWFASVNAIVTQHWQAGGLVTLCLCSLNNPVTGGDHNDRSFHDLQAMATPGTSANAQWLVMLDRVAGALATLRDAGVVVLWRPLHEMNLPNSAWWADEPPASYVALWRQMHHYLSVDKGLDNLLWVYAPNGVAYDNGTKPPADYYPGDDVVDVVGLDWYSDEPTKIGAGGYDTLIVKGKPFGFTEFGPDIAKSTTAHDLPVLLDGLRVNAPRAAFFWAWQSYGGHQMALVSHKNAKSALEHDSVMNCDDLDIGADAGRCQALSSLAPTSPGCGCQTGVSSIAAWLAMLLLLVVRREVPRVASTGRAG